MRQHQALNTRPSATPPSAGGGGPLAGGGSVGMTTPKQATSPVAAASFEAPLSGGSAAAYHHAYMTNVLSSTAQQHHPLPASPLQSTAGARFGAADNLDDVSATAVRELSQQLQAQLRDAKRRHLACTEVTLPNDLTQRIAAEIIRMSEREPCGERACTLFIEFESEPNKVKWVVVMSVEWQLILTYCLLTNSRMGPLLLKCIYCLLLTGALHTLKWIRTRCPSSSCTWHWGRTRAAGAPWCRSL